MTAGFKRTGRNRGGYGGESIDIAGVLREVGAVAAAQGWSVEDFGGGTGLSLPALHRPCSKALPGGPWRVYLSAGIHADEPAGPLAVLELLRRGRWPAEAEVWVCPCLNPTGFPMNRRENAAGLDLNRDYRHLRSPEVRAHVEWLGQQPAFDLTICLHEDWEAGGFYLYELNPDGRPSPAETVVSRVAPLCPIDPANLIDGREARGGIIRPALDPALRPEWPEAFYLLQRKTRHSFTLEAPSDFELAVRVAALVAATEGLLDSRGSSGRFSP